MVGTTLGPYRILEQIGAGGMGVVYRATDTQLGRDVALKVLPDRFASDAGRMSRFSREARLLASLNHPGIATVYGLAESGDVRAIAMELVEGRTLADSLRSGPMPLDEVLPIASQIAEALEAAHERGVIHRDLKPANIKVTPDGTVKVLDFGLAKALLEPASTSEITESPTVSEIGSHIGVILGTAGYMSPEQARGKPLDRRTDVWSFGCVLYEILTAKSVFGGATVSDTIARILEREPDWRLLPETTPPGVRHVLRRCLQKDPRQRLHDIADARLEIEETIAAGLSGELGAVPAAVVARPRWRRVTPWISLMIGAAGVSAGLWTVMGTPPAAHRPLMRFSVMLPPNEQLGRLDFPSLALSRAATHLAYVGSRGNTSRLLLHRMDSLQDEPMLGTEHAINPFFSPDGQWLGFFADGKLKKISLGGGAPQVLCNAPIGFGAVWGNDDIITFAPTGGSGLMQVPATGGDPREISRLNTDRGEFSHRWPHLLPDGDTLLFAAGGAGSWDDAQIIAQSLKTGAQHILIPGTFPHYLPTGHLVFARRGALWAVPLDVANQRVVGAPVMVLPKVWSSSDGAAQFSFSPLGHIVYVEGGTPGRTLVWVDRNKVIEPLAAAPGNYSEPRLSPDDSRLAVTITQASDNIWTYDRATSAFTQLTLEANNSMPVWTHDGTRMAFASNKAGAWNLFWKQADGTGVDERLTTNGQPQAPHAWSAAARSLVFVEQSPTTGRDIWIVPVDGDRTPRPIRQSPFNETGPAVSTDGRWLAYVSDESGGDEVYVISLISGPGARAARVSTDGGTEPVWSRASDEIFYRVGDKMMAVSIRTAPVFQADPPQLLFEAAYQKGRDSRPAYDVNADGRRFLMIRTNDGNSSPAGFQVVLEWFAELQRLEGSRSAR